MTSDPDKKQSVSLDWSLVWWTLGVTLVAVGIGVGAFQVLNKAFSPVSGLELLKVILTLIAGLGGVVYLVVRFRTQIITEAEDRRKEREDIRKEREEGRKDLEAQRASEQYIEDKLFRGIEMLGAEPVSTKIAGVYALTDVSDTYGGRYKQRVVDILCGYLRTPREDRELVVESTIINLVGERLSERSGIASENPNQSWSSCEFSFRGATIDTEIFWNRGGTQKNVDFRDCRFNQRVELSDFGAGGIYFANSYFRAGLMLNNLRDTQVDLTGTTFEKGDVYIIGSVEFDWQNQSPPLVYEEGDVLTMIPGYKLSAVYGFDGDTRYLAGYKPVPIDSDTIE